MNSRISHARFMGSYFGSQIHRKMNAIKTFHQNTIRNQQSNGFLGFLVNLKQYFSTHALNSNETNVQTQYNYIPNTQVGQTSEPNSIQVQKTTYVNYPQIFEQNKRRLKEAQVNPELARVLFDQNYLRTKIVDTKYFYADIVAIFSHVVRQLSASINSQSQNPALNHSVTSTHLHFLLNVYHMYVKQFKGYKQQTYSIIQHFFDHSVSADNFSISSNLQVFVYLRKFIDSETILGNGPKILNLSQKYCNFLEKAYQHQSTNLQKQSGSDASLKFNSKIIQKSKLLENYLLSYPNLWVSTFTNDSQIPSQNLSEKIITNFEYFVNEFSTLFRETIDHWINQNSSKNLPDPLPVNFSFRKYLLQLFKQEDLNKCFNNLRLVIHRLWSILETPKLLNQKSQQTTKKSHEKSLSQEKFIALVKNYEEGNLNVLKYLLSDKMAQNEEVKFMRLLILMKNILGYHTLRRIRDQDLTKHLQKLFSNNWESILTTKNQDKKREINILMGELISRLVSGSWTDQQDILGKYFQKNVVQNYQNKEMRNARDSSFND